MRFLNRMGILFLQLYFLLPAIHGRHVWCSFDRSPFRYLLAAIHSSCSALARDVMSDRGWRRRAMGRTQLERGLQQALLQSRSDLSREETAEVGNEIVAEAALAALPARRRDDAANWVH